MTRTSTRRKLAIATWGSPREGNIYGKLTLDATEALAYIEHVRQQTGDRITVTHLVGKAVAEALRQEPSLNGRILFGRYIPHRTVDIAFLVATADGGDLAKVKIEGADSKTVVEIARELRESAERVRTGKDQGFEKSKGLIRALPVFLLRPILWLTGFLTGALGLDMKGLGLERFPFGSCIVTSVGMFGLDEGFAPPTPFARVPVYVLVGAVRPMPAVEDGKVVIRQQLTLTATIDHRFIDGYQGAVLAKAVRRVFQDPWSLEPRALEGRAAAGA